MALDMGIGAAVAEAGVGKLVDREHQGSSLTVVRSPKPLLHTGEAGTSF